MLPMSGVRDPGSDRRTDRLGSRTTDPGTVGYRATATASRRAAGFRRIATFCGADCAFGARY